MSDICRLCLSYCTQNMRPLTDCDGIVYNSISFSMHIPLNHVFPSHVCSACVCKLTDFNHFYLQVKENEEILQRELNYGENALETFYEKIRNQVKDNTNELTNESIHNNTEYGVILTEVKTENVDLQCDISFDSEDELPLIKTKDNKTEDSQNTELIINTHTKSTDASIYPDNSYNFKCLTCFEMFVSQNKLLTHYNNTHKSKEEIKGDKYTSVSNNDKVLYKCTKCDKTYDNVRSVNKHAKTHCDENFHCRICGRTYKTVSEIIRHGRAHDGTKMSCSFGCDFATVYSGALKSHERRHRQDFKYKCETCGKSFQVRTWYEQHQNVHSGAKPFVCTVCGMAFHMDRYLKAHCSATHPDASSKKRYICVQCGTPCGNKKALTRHLKEHGIMSSVLCDLCGKTLSSNEQLAIHRRLHLGVKPHTCSICGKSFSKRCNLKLHQVTHSGARAHACAACGKRYTQRSTMVRHARRHHSAEKKCPICNGTFTSPADLTAHQKLCSS